ncbi:MAG: hypothetical protein ABSC05_24755 [Candidatus Solibacter sp.]|jgi:hypothetical protein
MRSPAVVVPAILLLAGAVYFFAKAKENTVRWADNSRFDQPAAAPAVNSVDDEYDLELVRKLLQTPDLNEGQANALLGAAGRRYVRRKLAYAAARQAVDAGGAVAGGLEPLRRELEAARKVCDVAESLGRRDQEMTAMAQADWELERRLAYIPSAMVGLAERYDGSSAFTGADLAEMEQAFVKHFGKPLPVSTRGESAVHRAMGFDHTGRFDVAVSPLQPEGVWARRYLTEKHATFLAFSSAVPGKATGAHIHIGPPSIRRVPGS